MNDATGDIENANAGLWPCISMLLLVLGLPLMMTLAWYHGGKANSRITGLELSIMSILLVGVAILFYVFVRPEESAAPAAREAGVSAARQDVAASRRSEFSDRLYASQGQFLGKRFVPKIGLVDYRRAKGWPLQCHPTIGEDFV